MFHQIGVVLLHTATMRHSKTPATALSPRQRVGYLVELLGGDNSLALQVPPCFFCTKAQGLNQSSKRHINFQIGSRSAEVKKNHTSRFKMKVQNVQMFIVREINTRVPEKLRAVTKYCICTLRPTTAVCGVTCLFIVSIPLCCIRLEEDNQHF